jgi:hypothetical protein
MSSRDYIRHVVSANTLPNDARVGDEYFDPVANKLYKVLAINGTTVTSTELLTTGPALANSSINIGKVNLVGYAPTNSANTGTLVVSGGVGISDSVYVGNRIGFSNTNNISVSYQTYNPATQTIDTFFG